MTREILVVHGGEVVTLTRVRKNAERRRGDADRVAFSVAVGPGKARLILLRMRIFLVLAVLTSNSHAQNVQANERFYM